MKFLGIDVGTGGTRAVVVDEGGAVVASATAEHAPFASPRVGWAEQDARDWWRASAEAARAVVSKVGAEGVYTAGVPPCSEWPKGLGLAFKVEDGEDRRARPVVAIEALRQLSVLDKNALDMLGPYSTFTVQNHRGDFVGQIQHLFELNRL